MTKAPEKLRKMIPVDEAIARWRQEPDFMKEHAALAEEFEILDKSINARKGGPARP